MRHLGPMLRAYIGRSGYTIYGIAKKSGVNRTTLQKVLSEERQPSEDMICRLLPFLKLSAGEQEDLLTALEIFQSGEAVCQKRRYIRSLLSSAFSLNGAVSQLDAGDMQEFPFDLSPSPPHPYRFPDGISSPLPRMDQLICGEVPVCMALDCLFKREAEKHSSIVLLNFPGLPEHLRQCIFCHSLASDDTKRIRIHHLTIFSKTTDTGSDTLVNLSHLASALPFLAAEKRAYQIYFLYSGTAGQEDCARMAFPYYVIFSDAMLFLSGDFKLALPCAQRDTLQFFRSHFEHLRKAASPLITFCPQPEALLSHLLEADSLTNGDPAFCLQYFPCLSIYLSQDILNACVPSHIAHRDLLIEAVKQRFAQVRGLRHYSCFFSKEGLIDFVETGALSDFPKEYVRPLLPKERLFVLEQLLAAVSQGQQTFQLVNYSLFPLSNSLSCILHGSSSLDFVIVDRAGRRHQYLFLDEPTIVEAFSDFFGWLSQSRFLCTLEESLAFIESCIKRLKSG